MRLLKVTAKRWGPLVGITICLVGAGTGWALGQEATPSPTASTVTVPASAGVTTNTAPPLPTAPTNARTVAVPTSAGTDDATATPPSWLAPPLPAVRARYRTRMRIARDSHVRRKMAARK
jgi:hypothetical protein